MVAEYSLIGCCDVLAQPTWLWCAEPDASARGARDRRWMHREAKLAVLGGLSAAEAISLGAPATDQRPWLDKAFQERRKRFDEGINEQARCIPWLGPLICVSVNSEGIPSVTESVHYS